MSLVSVIIPTYNREDTIKRTIDSVLQQSYDNIEILIIDDGSTDGTKNIILDYEDEYDSITGYFHPKNLGQGFTRNTGVYNANGSIISYVDSDDVIHKDHIKIVSNELKSSNDNIGGILTSYRMTGDRHKKIRYSNEMLDMCELDSIHGNSPAHFTGLSIKAQIIKNIGLHDIKMVRNADIDFLIQILKTYNVLKLDKILFDKFYNNEDRISKNWDKIIQGNQRFLDKHENTLNNSQKAHKYYQTGKAYLNKNNIKEANSCFSKSTELTGELKHYILISICLGKNGEMRLARTFIKKSISRFGLDYRLVFIYLLTYTSKKVFKTINRVPNYI